ncbi:MAG: GIY-YIG nuclease family protein [Euryarchaeota archaeon]|nr:GIY-YIG nuclease family protein [Euryarchaeota archaeon]
MGKLGTFFFPKGYYVYTGSALNNLDARIAHHKNANKKLRWHIDYLLRKARILNVLTIKTERKVECQLHGVIENLPNAKILIPKFGSSDCKCKSHLVYFKKLHITETQKKINILGFAKNK